MTRRKSFLILMAVWSALILSYCAYKESVLRFGNTAVLEIIPSDPRDIFRGDYIILDYKISRAGNGNISAGDVVYVPLIKDGNFHKAGDISFTKPKSGLFIKGTVRGQTGNPAIEYGIENYFVPEGKGRELERIRNSGSLSAVIKIDPYGNAAIKDLYINGKKADFKNDKNFETD
jgi:uncharacterized membrane-anchored protein